MRRNNKSREMSFKKCWSVYPPPHGTAFLSPGLLAAFSMLAERDLSDCRGILATSAFKETSWNWLSWDHAPRLSCTCQMGQKECEQCGKQCVNLKGVEDFFILTWVSSRYVEARRLLSGLDSVFSFEDIC